MNVITPDLPPSEGELQVKAKQTDASSPKNHFWKGLFQYLLWAIFLQGLGGLLIFYIMDGSASSAHGVGRVFQVWGYFLMAILSGIPINVLLIMVLGIPSLRRKFNKRLWGQIVGFVLLLGLTVAVFWLTWS